MVIEEATGHDWRDEVEGRIIEPLGMDDTYAPETTRGWRCRTRRPTSGFPRAATPWTDTTVANVSSLDAGGEMISTQQDLETLMTAPFGGELLPESRPELQRP